jgi:hypothetical protein
MKIYVAALVGYVPDEIVMCLSAFLDACYIARRQDIDANALDSLGHALDRFWNLREVFRIPGVRPTGFSLPRQHSLTHYRRMIEDFGAPGGLCSSITESRHITAVKKPWRRSNRYQALGQMLLINQRLDKLAAMRSDFTSRITISGGCLPGGNITHLCNVQTSVSNGDNNEDDDDGGPVDEDSNVLGHVILARSRGTFTISFDATPF